MTSDTTVSAKGEHSTAPRLACWKCKRVIPTLTPHCPYCTVPLLIDEKFVVAGFLGQGQFGDVYVAVERELGREVAVKVLKRGHDGKFKALFKKEAKAIAALSHPNIVPIFTYSAEHSYLAMRYLKGGRLREKLAEHGLLQVDQFFVYMGQILAALAYAHKNGVWHRDLKPENVVFDDDGQVYLCDFGLAKIVEDSVPRATTVGTPGYMAPEVAAGVPYDQRCDVFPLVLWPTRCCRADSLMTATPGLRSTKPR